MASLGETFVKVNMDVEPTETAKAFIRAEVIKVFRELFGDGAWLEELAVQALEKASQKREKA